MWLVMIIFGISFECIFSETDPYWTKPTQKTGNNVTCFAEYGSLCISTVESSVQWLPWRIDAETLVNNVKSQIHSQMPQKSLREMISPVLLFLW